MVFNKGDLVEYIDEADHRAYNAIYRSIEIKAFLKKSGRPALDLIFTTKAGYKVSGWEYTDKMKPKYPPFEVTKEMKVDWEAAKAKMLEPNATGTLTDKDGKGFTGAGGGGGGNLVVRHRSGKIVFKDSVKIEIKAEDKPVEIPVKEVKKPYDPRSFFDGTLDEYRRGILNSWNNWR